VGDIFIHPFNFQLGEHRATLVCVIFTLLQALQGSPPRRSKIMDSAPLFKFMYLIVGPTVLWAQSVVIAGPSGAGSMTFGQVRNFCISFLSNLCDAHIPSRIDFRNDCCRRVTSFADRHLSPEYTGYSESGVDVGGFRRLYNKHTDAHSLSVKSQRPYLGPTYRERSSSSYSINHSYWSDFARS